MTKVARVIYVGTPSEWKIKVLRQLWCSQDLYPTAFAY